MPPLARKTRLILACFVGLFFVALWDRMNGAGRVLLGVALLAGVGCYISSRRKK